MSLYTVLRKRASAPGTSFKQDIDVDRTVRHHAAVAGPETVQFGDCLADRMENNLAGLHIGSPLFTHAPLFYPKFPNGCHAIESGDMPDSSFELPENVAVVDEKFRR